MFSAEGTFILNGKGDGLGVMTGGSVEREREEGARGVEETRERGGERERGAGRDRDRDRERQREDGRRRKRGSGEKGYSDEGEDRQLTARVLMPRAYHFFLCLLEISWCLLLYHPKLSGPRQNACVFQVT